MMRVHVGKDDSVVVLVCGTSWMTGSCRGCSCRDVYVFTSTHCVSLTTAARKHRDVVLPHCRTVRSTLCVSAGFPDSSRREHDWSSGFNSVFRHDLVIPQTWLAQPPSSLAAVAWMRRHACVLAAPQSARNQSAVMGLSERLSSLRRNTAVRLKFNVARQLQHPDGRTASER